MKIKELKSREAAGRGGHSEEKCNRRGGASARKDKHRVMDADAASIIFHQHYSGAFQVSS